jgi:hypothetical protein
MAEQEQLDLEKKLGERFLELPKVVQDAITSADVQKRMREVADVHKLHLDQWQILENEVMLALLGFQPVEDLAKNIQNEVNVPEETAATLAADISKIVFEPIRGELERSLEHPEAKAEEKTGVETVRQEMLGNAENAVPFSSEVVPASVPAPVATAPSTPPVSPATPPAPAPTGKVEREPVSTAYHAGEPSSARKSVDNDPYRETPA